MATFPSNSFHSKDQTAEMPIVLKSDAAPATTPSATIPEKNLQKIISGTAKKRSAFQQFVDGFFNRDLPNVKNYILVDVLIPALKDAIRDIVQNGISMLLYGEVDRNRKGIAPYISYQSFGAKKDSRPSTRVQSASKGYSGADFEFQSLADAKQVLDIMYELLSKYGMVSVGDLNELVGYTGNYTDNDYGWTSLADAEPYRTRTGYMLRLPRPMPIL